jgi:DNA-binding MarR family transcriptional regulator
MESARALHLFERISALMRGEIRRSLAAEGLEPVHVLALWYLSRANRFSDNPLAVAEFLGLSKGNMSQRLNVLERRGFVSKSVDEADRRRIHLRPTAAGRKLLRASYPPAAWPADMDWEGLQAALDDLLRAIVAGNRFRTFGQCRTCRFHEQRDGGLWCALLRLKLSTAQAEQICQEHAPRPAT